MRLKRIVNYLGSGVPSALVTSLHLLPFMCLVLLSEYGLIRSTVTKALPVHTFR